MGHIRSVSYSLLHLALRNTALQQIARRLA